MKKPVNRYTSNEFHDWQRENMPGMVIQDLDAWALVVSSPDRTPRALVELKRSSAPVTAWRPYAADRNNFASLFALGEAAGIPFWLVYFQMGVTVTDETPLALFRFSQVEPEYRGIRNHTTPVGLRDHYLAPLLRRSEIRAA